MEYQNNKENENYNRKVGKTENNSNSNILTSQTKTSSKEVEIVNLEEMLDFNSSGFDVSLSDLESVAEANKILSGMK